MKNIYYISLFIVTLISCSRENSTEVVTAESKIVVEGSIEQGDVAQVILSRSIPVESVIDSSTVLNHVIRSARVSVSDGTNEELLRLKNNTNVIPPFTYYGSDIIGEVGKTYTLKIEYLNKVLTAETTIPQPVLIQSARYAKNDNIDYTGYITINFEDLVNEKNYYQIATRLEYNETVFTPALYGNLDDANFQTPSVSLQIKRGVSIFPKTKFEPYFTDGDVVAVKLKTMNLDAFNFWNSWQNEIINGLNPIFPSNSSLKSNIKGGGVGIWAGYGQHTIIVRTLQKK